MLPYSPVELKSVKNTSASPVMDSWREQWWSAIHCEQRKDTHTQEDTEVQVIYGHCRTLGMEGLWNEVLWDYRSRLGIKTREI